MRLDKGYNSVDLQNRLDPEDLKSHFTSWISRLTGLVAQLSAWSICQNHSIVPQLYVPMMKGDVCVVGDVAHATTL